MSKKERQKIEIVKSKDVSPFRHISDDDLLAESEKYDMENYNPLENLDEKDVLIPKNKSDVITIRLTPQENYMISNLANENGLSKSSFVRMIIKRALKQK